MRKEVRGEERRRKKCEEVWGDVGEGRCDEGEEKEEEEEEEEGCPASNLKDDRVRHLPFLLPPSFPPSLLPSLYSSLLHSLPSSFSLLSSPLLSSYSSSSFSSSFSSSHPLTQLPSLPIPSPSPPLYYHNFPRLCYICFSLIFLSPRFSSF